jgi:hypothetical protein
VKKIPKSRACKIPAIILHREDLIELVGLLGTPYKSLQIHNGEYEFTSIEELLQNDKNPISELHIFSNEVCLDFHYNRQAGVTFVCPVNKPEEEALFLRTREFLSQRCNRWHYLFDVRVWALLLTLSAALFSLFFQKLYPPDFIPIWVLIPIPMLIISIPPLNGYILNLVTTNSRGERGLFWKNNKDKIFLSAISAVISAIITWCITKLK